MALNEYGPIIWKVIHAASMKATTSSKKMNIRLVMESLCSLFPCSNCREHLKLNLCSKPINKYSGDNCIFLWSYLLHDAVNNQLGKKSISYSLAKNIYYNLPNVDFYRCIWYVIHTLAAHNTDKRHFEMFVTNIIPFVEDNKFFVNNCLPIGNDIFSWSWESHNKVNQFLRKPTLTFQTFTNIYKNSSCPKCLIKI